MREVDILGRHQPKDGLSFQCRGAMRGQLCAMTGPTASDELGAIELITFAVRHDGSVRNNGNLKCNIELLAPGANERLTTAPSQTGQSGVLHGLWSGPLSLFPAQAPTCAASGFLLLDHPRQAAPRFGQEGAPQETATKSGLVLAGKAQRSCKGRGV